MVVKWFIPEENSDKAVSLRQAHVRGKVQLYAPDLLLMELANVLRRSSQISAEEITQALETLSTLGVEIISFNLNALAPSVVLCLEHDLAIYDSYFVTLAQMLRMPLVTADQKMLSNLTTAGSNVMNLKDI